MPRFGALFLAFVIVDCATTQESPPLPQHLASIRVEFTNEHRNTWLHNNCQVKATVTAAGDRDARQQAAGQQANYVEILYMRSADDLDVVLFACPKEPP
jgi:hypothetical protein